MFLGFLSLARVTCSEIASPPHPASAKALLGCSSRCQDRRLCHTWEGQLKCPHFPSGCDRGGPGVSQLADGGRCPSEALCLFPAGAGSYSQTNKSIGHLTLLSPEPFPCNRNREGECLLYFGISVLRRASPTAQSVCRYFEVPFLPCHPQRLLAEQWNRKQHIIATFC